MNYFRLSKHSRITDGYKKSIICNLHTRNVLRISKQLSYLLQELDKGLKISEITGDTDIFINTLNFLALRGFGYFEDQYQYIKLQQEHFSTKIDLMWLNLTSKCNYRCKHCYEESSSEIKESQQLTIKEYKKFIHEVNTSIGIKAIQLIGGEPLLRGKKFIFELLDFLIEEGITFLEVYTNCSLLDVDYCEYFRKNNIHVATSLYSEKELIHDSITQRQGSFQDLNSKIKLLQKYKINYRVSVVIMQMNENEICSIQQFVKSAWGIENCKVDVIRPIGRGRLVDVFPTKLFVKNHFNNTNKLLSYNTTQFDYKKTYHSCWGNKICVSSSGDIYPCIMSGYRLGNIDNICEIWLSQNSYRKINKDKVRVCADCEYRYLCDDCMAINEHAGIYEKPFHCSYNPYECKWESKKDNYLMEEIIKS